MRGLAADIADQTCKTAAQSRTRFVGHRQLPWIHAHHSGIRRLDFVVRRRVGKAHCAVPTITSRAYLGGHASLCPPYVSDQCVVRSSRSRWITSVASLR